MSVLMQALSEMPEAQDISIMEEVRAGMLALIEAQTEVKRQDKRMVEQVSELDEAIRSMTEELGRKVAVDDAGGTSWNRGRTDCRDFETGRRRRR